MPTVSEVVGGVLANALAHPKSTLQAMLTSLMFGSTLLVACGCVPARYMAMAGTALVVAKVGLGMLQRDGGTDLKLPPGTKLDVETHTGITTPKQ